jgi:ABC-type transporter Mla subunit MlaD
MAELTHMDEKLAEVLGLAQAAQDTVGDVLKLAEEDQERSVLEQMAQESRETAERTEQFIETLEGKKTAILDKARETKSEAKEMAQAYLEGKDEVLDGFEFLTMAEAGELGHWQIVRKMNEQVRDERIEELAEFAVPLQQRHFETTLETSLTIAEREEATAPA